MSLAKKVPPVTKAGHAGAVEELRQLDWERNHDAG